MSRAPQSATGNAGTLSPEIARIVEALARDMARQDHELSMQPPKEGKAKCQKP